VIDESLAEAFGTPTLIAIIAVIDPKMITGNVIINGESQPSSRKISLNRMDHIIIQGISTAINNMVKLFGFDFPTNHRIDAYPLNKNKIPDDMHMTDPIASYRSAKANDISPVIGSTGSLSPINAQSIKPWNKDNIPNKVMNKAVRIARYLEYLALFISAIQFSYIHGETIFQKTKSGDNFYYPTDNSMPFNYKYKAIFKNIYLIKG
jgi:hypothetical protein